MRFPLHRHLALAACIGFVGACSDDSGTVGFRVPPTVVIAATTVVAGDGVPVRIENRSAVTWSYSMCGQAFLQRRNGDQWTTLPPPLLLCADELIDLPPGDVVTEEKLVPLAAEPGTYRVLMIFQLQGVQFDSASNPFEVTARPDA